MDEITNDQPLVKGYFDRIDEKMIARGWAVDMSDFDRKISVRIVDEVGTILAEGVADRYREDLAQKGIGEGTHAFEIELPETIRDRAPLLLHIEPTEGTFANAGTKEVETLLPAPEVPAVEFGAVQRALFAEFDPDWFRRKYGIRLEEDEELFRFYLSVAGSSQLSPSGRFDERVYLAKYPDVHRAVSEGKLCCGFEHYIRWGKKEGRTARIETAVLDVPGAESRLNASLRYIKALFDEAWYLETYPRAAEEMKARGLATAFDHYLEIGIGRSYSPNDWFDESWYVAFYSEVSEALKEGRYLCGFEHYLARGREEKFLPKHEPFSNVNYKFSEAVRPVGLDNEKVLEERVFDAFPVIRKEREKPRMVFIVPTMDRDIMFGGYIGLIELVRRFLEHGLDIKMIISDDPHMSETYFWYNLTRLIPGVERYRARVEFQNLVKEKTIEVSRKDRFFAYSAWTALRASKLVRYTDEEKFIYLRQEDERVFNIRSSQSAIIDYIYRLPQVAIFNSRELLEYFKKKKIGFFGRPEEKASDVFYFDPVICRVEPFDPGKVSASEEKKFVFYARPEAHAGRNLFEIGVMALNRAIREGVFDEHWSFYGIGAAREYTVELAEGRTLQIKSKVSLDEYKKMLKEYDVGMFLMYAPHPGLLGLEMTSAGLVTIVNTFDYRDEEYFKKISGNFVVADPDPYSLAKAMKEAVIKSSKPEERIANAYRPKHRSWDEVFDDVYIRRILGAVGIDPDKKEERQESVPIAAQGSGEKRKPGRRRLIVHIGGHKTGSTSIQKFMFDYQEYFRERFALYYPTRGVTRPQGMLWGQHLLTWSFTPKDDAFSREILDQAYAEFLESLEAYPETDVLVSSEDFVWNIHIPEFITEMRKYFDEIDVILYVRNQVDAAVSLFQTAVVNSGYTGTFDEWFHRAYRLFDYMTIIREWEDQGCRVTVKPFFREAFVGQDVILDFLDTLGGLLGREILVPDDYTPAALQSNVTVPDFITEMIHHYNGNEEAKEKIVPLLRELGQRLILANREIPTMGFLPAETKKKIRERYLEQNRVLCRNYLGEEYLEWMNREIDERDELSPERLADADSRIAELAKYTIKTLEKLTAEKKGRV